MSHLYDVFPTRSRSAYLSSLAEVHRVLDDGHECSLQVGILMDLMNQPIDPSFAPSDYRAPRLSDGTPVITVENLQLTYTTPNGRPRPWFRQNPSRFPP